MNKNTLSEILNSNQELLQDLAQSEFLQNNFVGMLRNIESIIPEDSRENFYTNLKTLRLNFNDETMIEKQHGGAYSRKNNEISMDKRILNLAGRKISDGETNFDEEMLKTMYHELLHMASTTRDDYGEVGGFQNIEKTEEGEFLYADILEGMTEGFTEYLTLLSFGKENFETSSTYGRQINSMNHLSMIVGLEIMKKSYFNNRNGMQNIEKALQEIDGKQSHIDLYMDIENDYKFGPAEELFEPTTLVNIDKRLLELSKGKIEIMRRKNPNLSEEYIMDFWTMVSKVINSKENLKLMGEDASLYKGIEELENIFKNLSSDITQSEAQELKKDDLNKGDLWMEEKTENKKEPKKVNIGNYKKFDNILDNDRLIKIYGLLPDKESKREFLETALSTYEDRLAEKFQERLEDEFEANDSQIKQGQLKENIRNKRSIEDILRSRRREPLTQGATERINHLIAELQKGNYISKEDREFLAKHLAERSNVVETSPSSRREEIRSTIDTYIKAKNKENSNRADSYKYKQDLQENIRRLKIKLKEKILHQNDPITHMEANGAHYGEDINEDPYIRVTKRREKEIHDIKSQIVQLEELQDIEETRNPLNSMLNMPDPEFDVEKNNIDLEELMDILDRESAELLKNGVELPETDIREDDVVEIQEDDEQTKDTIQADESKTEGKPVYVVNVQASLEQKNDKNNNVIVVEPTLGTSIEDFAEAIMKNKQDSKQIVSRFNDFKINSNDYQNAEELIQAYEKHIQEHSSETKKITSKQEKITPSEIESVVAINPRALQIMSETSATKQLVRANEQEKDVEVEKE